MMLGGMDGKEYGALHAAAAAAGYPMDAGKSSIFFPLINKRKIITDQDLVKESYKDFS